MNCFFDAFIFCHIINVLVIMSITFIFIGFFGCMYYVFNGTFDFDFFIFYSVAHLMFWLYFLVAFFLN